MHTHTKWTNENERKILSSSEQTTTANRALSELWVALWYDHAIIANRYDCNIDEVALNIIILVYLYRSI